MLPPSGVRLRCEIATKSPAVVQRSASAVKPRDQRAVRDDGPYGRGLSGARSAERSERPSGRTSDACWQWAGHAKVGRPSSEKARARSSAALHPYGIRLHEHIAVSARVTFSLRMCRLEGAASETRSARVLAALGHIGCSRPRNSATRR